MIIQHILMIIKEFSIVQFILKRLKISSVLTKHSCREVLKTIALSIIKVQF